MRKKCCLGLIVSCLLAGGCSWFRDLVGPGGQVVKVQAFGVETRDVEWQGWSAIEQTNGLVTLRHVPAAGGRTLSLQIGGDDAFVVFPQHRGKTYPVDSRDNSLHFGGHYTCIGPERIWGVHEQPFNPHAGPYRVERDTPGEDRHHLRFVSQTDTWRNATISIDRAITMFRGTTHVVIDETVTNRGPDPLEFYIWDFTQIDAVNRHRPDHPLRRMTFYVPVPIEEERKKYTVFFEREPKMLAQFDETLDAGVLAIHFAAEQFKIASQAGEWWVAAVDHDTGWTYVKAFDETPGARFVDGNGPIEVYGSFMDEPMGQPFVEMELLSGMGRYQRGEAIKQREHWYAAICKGPVLAATPVGVVCEKLKAAREGENFVISGRFGVFYLGTAQLRMVDRKGKTLQAGNMIVIDPRREFKLNATMPEQKDAVGLMLDVFDYQGNRVYELARTSLR